MDGAVSGTKVRKKHFRRDVSPVIVEIDGTEHTFNVDKKSFWTETCGELIGLALRDWKDPHSLERRDRGWLWIVELYRRFRLECPQPRRTS